jgi:hypothetical protein
MNPDCPQSFLLSQFIDDELSDEERSNLLQHAAQCESCAREIDALRNLRSALSLLSTDPSAKQRIRNKLLNKNAGMTFTGRRLLVPMPIAATIALILGASVIGNIYWGFFRPVREQIVYKNMYLPNQSSDPLKNNTAMKKAIDYPPDRQATADLQSMDSGASPKKHTRVNAVPVEHGMKPFVATLQTDGYIAEFSTMTQYRVYQIPKIYNGGLNFSGQR